MVRGYKVDGIHPMSKDTGFLPSFIVDVWCSLFKAIQKVNNGML